MIQYQEKEFYNTKDLALSVVGEMENCHHLVLAAQRNAAAERVQQDPS